MHVLALIILILAALAFFVAWYESTPRTFASIPFGLLLLTVGLILVFVLQIEPIVHLTE